MNCEGARELIGLGAEVAVTDRAAMERHVAACAECAAVAADEAAMRSLLSARSVPAFAVAQRQLLLQVPPPGLGAALWRARIETWVPVATVAIVLVLGARALDGRADPPQAAPPPNQDLVVPTQIARAGPVHAAPPEDVTSAAAEPERPPVPNSVPPADVVYVVEPAPVVVPLTVPDSAAPVVVGAGSEPDAGARRVEDGTRGRSTLPTAPVPTATVAPTQGVLLDFSIQAVTDLAGGSPTCPGCDGVTPADGQAASQRPVGRASAHVWALTEDGVRLDLGTLTLEPVSSGVALATARVPEAAGYAVRFESAEAGFALCPSAEPEVIVLPGEGGLFATFRLWAGCPAPPPLIP